MVLPRVCHTVGFLHISSRSRTPSQVCFCPCGLSGEHNKMCTQLVVSLAPVFWKCLAMPKICKGCYGDSRSPLPREDSPRRGLCRNLRQNQLWGKEQQLREVGLQQAPPLTPMVISQLPGRRDQGTEGTEKGLAKRSKLAKGEWSHKMQTGHVWSTRKPPGLKLTHQHLLNKIWTCPARLDQPSNTGFDPALGGLKPITWSQPYQFISLVMK